jgi:hypothetical protein
MAECDGDSCRSARSDATVARVCSSRTSMRSRCAAIAALRAAVSGAASTDRTSSSGISRSRKRFMSCAVGTCVAA